MLALAIPVLASAQGQQGSGSPYSSHGLGDLTGTAQVVQAGMGGLGVVLADPYGVARANPATYPYLSHAVYEMGLAVRSMDMTIAERTSRGRSTRILGLSLGVPFARGKWGMALGLQPYSTVAYQIEETGAVDGGTVRYQYSGSGGINRAYLGFGRVLWQRSDSARTFGRLSIGANLEYLFGSVEAARKAYYPLGTGHYNSSITSTLALKAPTATVGLLYSGDLRSQRRAKERMGRRKEALRAADRREEMEWLNAGRDPKDRKPLKLPKGEGEALRFRVGLGIDAPVALNARHTSLATSFLLSSAGVEFPRDTAAQVNGARGSLDLPIGVSAGLSLYNARWTIAAEVQQRDWSALRADVEGYDLRTDLRTATTYAVGASYRPAGEMGGSFLQRAIYRTGFRYTAEPIALRETSIRQLGMSFGVSLPLMGSNTRSRLNLATEIGERGTTANGLLRERFANIYIGVSITPDLREQWFKKRRID